MHNNLVSTFIVLVLLITTLLLFVNYFLTSQSECETYFQKCTSFYDISFDDFRHIYIAVRNNDNDLIHITSSLYFDEYDGTLYRYSGGFFNSSYSQLFDANNVPRIYEHYECYQYLKSIY